MTDCQRVLILEDDEQLGFQWRRALEAANFQVVLATTADEAIGELRGSVFDVVVTDIFIALPDGKYSSRGGLSLMSEIRLNHKPPPAIITVSGGLDESRIRMMSELLGARTVLHKPVSSDALVGAVQELLVTA